MKNNYLDKIDGRPDSILFKSKRPVCLIGLMLGLFTCQETQAQFVNQSTLKVANGAIMSIYMDYKNDASGIFINDGQVHVFENWMNNGQVSYGSQSTGATFFTGAKEQFIEGSNVSDFQNVIFDNLTSLVPFQLKTAITVGNNSDFKNGIINAADYDGKMIFKEKAGYSNAGDQSFVDGQVEKKGLAEFRFPVGDELYFRPSYHAKGSSEANDYTTQYFNKNSETIVTANDHAHNQKEKTIYTIDNTEYWKVTQETGSNENIVLSLTLDPRTTPPEFFIENPDTELAIVRWDDAEKVWVNEKGATSDTPVSGENYTKLVTAQVNGYGIFTVAIVKKIVPSPKLEVFNAISPNGDGINDAFHIKGIADYPDNTVEIYNRWGVKVYDTKSYNESDNMFTGYSDGRATIKRGEKLPTGTYFYILKYNNTQKVVEQSGYLYINNQ